LLTRQKDGGQAREPRAKQEMINKILNI
jgi:hypothetical protein